MTTNIETQIHYNNIPPEAIIKMGEPLGQLPGEVRDLRISLTSLCNLQCPHCHNEGQPPPWVMKNTNRPDVTVEQLLQLILMGQSFKARSVKFTGGEPSYYPYYQELMNQLSLRNWNDLTFGIATNGIPFLPPEKLHSLIKSPLYRVHVGLDSIRNGEKSKPKSPTGVEGIRLLEEMILPLWHEWQKQHKQVVINTVYTGDKERVHQILERAYVENLLVNIIEVNGVMGSKYETRQSFLSLISEIANLYQLEVHLDEELNQVYLSNKDRIVFRFYQDHCADQDCGHCRKIHMRVNSTSEGFVVIPCFLKTQGKSVSIVENEIVSKNKFQEAINVMGMGPQWKTTTER